MNAPSGERVTEWAGGSLSELMSVLSAAALPARIRVFAPGKGSCPGRRSTPPGRRPQRRLRWQQAWPRGGIRPAAAGRRPLRDRYPLAGSRDRIPGEARPGRGESGPAPAGRDHALLRGLRADLHARGVAWRGASPHQLPAWRIGRNFGRRQRSSRTTPRGDGLEGGVLRDRPALASDAAFARALQTHRWFGRGGRQRRYGTGTTGSGERARRGTDPFITIGAVKRDTTTRPAGAMRSTGEISSSPRLPPGPPLPGFQARIAAAARAHPAEKAGPRPAPFGPTPAHPLAAPPTSKTAPAAQAPLPPLAAPTVVGRDARPAPPVPWPTAGTSAAGCFG
jgi:hypothetical protein